MSPEEVRLECLRLAVSLVNNPGAVGDGSYIAATAERWAEFVLGVPKLDIGDPLPTVAPSVDAYRNAPSFVLKGAEHAAYNAILRTTP